MLARFVGRPRLCWVALAALIIVGVLGAGPVLAQSDLPTEPVLRIATNQHTAVINRVATDAQNRYAVTVSNDKTARVWSLPEGHRLGTIRVPIGDGPHGELYAVAMAPDGNTVAIGGWTSSSGKNENVYMLDRTSGTVTRRLSGLPDMVKHLAYSPDGRYLAASLGGGNGIRVYDVLEDYKALPSDQNYAAVAAWADFDRTGRLVTTSYDGYVRLYAAGRYDKPVAKQKPMDRAGPQSAVFSPDGRSVAVGISDKPNVFILSGTDLKQLYRPDIRGLTDDMSSVAWSSDGRFLFAGGRQGELRRTLRRWENGGRGPFKDSEVTSDTIMEIWPLNDGSMLFATADPAIGIIDKQGQAKTLVGPEILDYKDRDAVLRLSPEGKVVEQGTSNPARKVRFSLAKRQVDVDPPRDASLAGPVTKLRGLSITNWENRYDPAVNGTTITLDDYERSQSLAIAPEGEQFALGAEWSISLLDKAAELVWPRKIDAPGVVWQVNITRDGRLIVAAIGDGTIRWYRMSDGEEVLALFIHQDGRRWVAWSPEGYYDASAGADELIGWHINKGYDKAPDFYSVARFRERFYRPDVIARVLDTLSTDEAVRLADLETGRQTNTKAAIASTLPPIIQIAEPSDGSAANQPELTLMYAAQTPTGDPVTRVDVLLDGRKVERADDLPTFSTDAARVGRIKISLPRRDANVSLIAYNKFGASEPAQVRVLWRGPGIEPKPKLYVLVVGISDYADEKLKLNFAAKDAENFLADVKAQKGLLYEDVINVTGEPLLNGAATKDAIIRGLNALKRQTSPRDVAMIFFSGHGVKGPDQGYYFLPSNFDRDDFDLTALPGFELRRFVSQISGKTIFFFDTCYSGDVLAGKAPSQVDVDRVANELASAETGVVVFASSTGNQLSREDNEAKNGYFTRAILEGTRGAADYSKDGFISVSEMELYVSRRVIELTKGDQKPMTAKPKTVEDFSIIALH